MIMEIEKSVKKWPEMWPPSFHLISNFNGRVPYFLGLGRWVVFRGGLAPLGHHYMPQDPHTAASEGGGPGGTVARVASVWARIKPCLVHGLPWTP